MTSQPDYYDVLQIAPAASQQEISRAYRALMRTHHPDLDGGAADREEVTGGEVTGEGVDGGGADVELHRGELLQIMQAFSVLRDPVRRAAYDRSRTAAAGSAPQSIPVRNVPSPGRRQNYTIRITPVRWESGPWA
jgi:DnaJ-class molecular chaperone